MNEQLTFPIHGMAYAPHVIRPHFCQPPDAGRLAGQNQAILERLRRGPATNKELAAISLKYTSRISEVRAWLELRGETITCERLSGGVSEYSVTKK